MKKYTNATLEFVSFETADVITISNVSRFDAENENGGAWSDGLKITM